MNANNTDFIAFLPELQSYLYRIVANRQEAEDLAQETYLKATHKADTFKGNASYKTWVFTIASNLAKDSLRARNRWAEDTMDLVKDAHVNDPALMAKKFEVAATSEHGKFVIREHLNYCFTCTAKTLLLTHQMVLLLKEIYGFKVHEIMQILDLTEGKVKHALADARKDMNRIFKKRCALINKEGMCSQCTGLNNMHNPEQDAQAEANKLKMVKEQQGKQYEQLLDLRLNMVADLDPLNGEGIDLHNYLLEHSPRWAAAQRELAKKK